MSERNKILCFIESMSCVVFDGSNSSFAEEDVKSIAPRRRSSKHYEGNHFSIRSGSIFTKSTTPDIELTAPDNTEKKHRKKHSQNGESYSQKHAIVEVEGKTLKESRKKFARKQTDGERQKDSMPEERKITSKDIAVKGRNATSEQNDASNKKLDHNHYSEIVRLQQKMAKLQNKIAQMQRRVLTMQSETK